MRNAVKIVLIFIILSNRLTGQPFFERYESELELLPLINTAASEISPAIVEGKLYFTALGAEATGRGNILQKNKLFYNVYFTQVDSKGYPQVLRKLVPGFGNAYHEGPVSWCETTGELFVTQSNLPDGDTNHRLLNKELVRLKLVIMKKKDDRWFKVEDLPFNRSEFHYAHPAISVTGDTLIFTSDMKGGFGNTDLYMSVRTKGQWSDPMNLGEKVNTAGNEMFPTFGPGGILIFSSDGHDGVIGQLDLFYTDLSGGIPVPMQQGINSQYDDFGLVVHPSKEYGYFSSNRPGSGSDDIYRIEFSSLYEKIGGLVLDNKGKPVNEAIVFLKDCNDTPLQQTLTGSDGKFLFEVFKDSCYQALASKEGYRADLKPFHLEKSVNLIIREEVSYRILALAFDKQEPIPEAKAFCNDQHWEADSTGWIKIPADSLKGCDLRVTRKDYFDYVIEEEPYRFVPGSNITDTVRLFKKEKNKAYQLDNITFFLDKWRLLPESEQELQKVIKLMKDNPGLKIELASHTDSRGEAKYNLWLSQKRADSAADFLIENGIARERVVSKGYGESRLINHCGNGVPCSEAEHLENRRTEFIILDY